MRIKFSTVKTSICLALLFVFGFKFSDDNTQLQKIVAKLTNFAKHYYQQKIYLHIDKQNYETGQTIWFKTYLVDADGNIPDTATTHLYVELIDFNKTIVYTKVIKLDNGFGFGDFFLSDTLVGGYYQIRAYTDWMKNFNNDFLFCRTFELTNAKFYNYLSRSEKRHFNQAEKNRSVQFFPEGGHLVNGLDNKIAFKAINGLGKSIHCTGTLFDNQNKQIATIETEYLGMGTFNLTPDINNKYYVIAKFDDGKTQKIKFPEIEKNGYILKITSDESNIYIDVKINTPPSGDPLQNRLIVLAHTNQKIIFTDDADVSKKRYSNKIDKNLFPTGIAHITIFNGFLKPLCQRLVFINHCNLLNVSIAADKTVYSPHEKTTIDFEVKDQKGNPVRGNFSVSVIDNSKVAADSLADNIISNLLLTSDLKGSIENPASYFDVNNLQTNKYLDLLMLTQGWRRFDWSEILNDRFPIIKSKPENGITISGRITKPLFDISSKKATIELTILNKYNDVFKDTTDVNGRFCFEKLNYYDTLDILLESRNVNGGRKVVINVDTSVVPEVKFDFLSCVNKNIIETKLPKGKKPEKRYIYHQPVSTNSLHSSADATIYINPNEVSGNENVLEYLRGRVAGLTVSGTGDNTTATIRGSKSFASGGDAPLALIDGTQVPIYQLNEVSLQDVEKIEVLKNSSNTAIYGLLGANGVIAVYTKHGFNIKWGELAFKMLAYATPKQFYAPVYDVPNKINKPDNRSTIFWTPVLITDEKGKAHCSFYNADNPATICVVVEGISATGQIGRQVFNYQVKK